MEGSILDDDDLGLLLPSTTAELSKDDDGPVQGRRGRRSARRGRVGTSLDLGIDITAEPVPSGPNVEAAAQAQVDQFVDAAPPQPLTDSAAGVDVRAMRSSWDDDDSSPSPTGQQSTSPLRVDRPQTHVDLDIFDEDAPAATEEPTKLPASVPLSRRKQQQLDMERKKHDDKYAEEKEQAFESIEELDDSGKVDLKGKVAQAPLEQQVQYVDGIDQLESAKLQRLRHYISRKSSRTETGDHDPLDLSQLMGLLLPEHMVMEDDDVWDENLLLTAVASDMHQRTGGRAAEAGG